MQWDGRRGFRLAVLGASLALGVLAYLHLVPLPLGMAASCLIPLVWAVDAYRAQKRLRFAVAAALVLITALPLLRLARWGF